MDESQEIYKHSKLAKDMVGKECKMITVLYGSRFMNTDVVGYLDGIGFHPNGNCGCMNNCGYGYDDEKCKKIIWMEGCFDTCYNKGILLLGNNFGSIKMNAIIFNDELIIEPCELLTCGLPEKCKNCHAFKFSMNKFTQH